MTATLRSIAALLCVATITLLPPLRQAPDAARGAGGASVGDGREDAARVTLHHASPDEIGRVEWALARFTQAGLRLPPVNIEFHDHVDGCDGHPGLMQLVAGVAEVRICASTKHVLLHELAHAWESSALTEDTRAAFLQYWDLDAWHDPGADWNRRGREKAADTIAFALNEVPREPRRSLLDFLCGYPLLTDGPLPEPAAEGVGDRCDGIAGS